MTRHYVHRPTPKGGETDARFRDLGSVEDADIWHRRGGWRYLRIGSATQIMPTGSAVVWRMPVDDTPSAELQALAERTRLEGRR